MSRSMRLSYAEYHERLFARSGKGMYSQIARNNFDPYLAVSWYHSREQWNRGGSQWPELDAMVEAALAAGTPEEARRLIAEADEYAMSRHWLIWGPMSTIHWYVSRGSPATTVSSTAAWGGGKKKQCSPASGSIVR